MGQYSVIPKRLPSNESRKAWHEWRQEWETKTQRYFNPLTEELAYEAFIAGWEQACELLDYYPEG